jgi:hypothetical protein
MEIMIEHTVGNTWCMQPPARLTQMIVERPGLDRDTVLRDYVTGFGASHADQLAMMSQLAQDTGARILQAVCEPDVTLTTTDQIEQYYCVSFCVAVTFEWLQPIEQFVTLAQLNGFTVTNTP